MRDARQSQGRQMLHAIRALLRERRERASQVRRNGRVGGAEVAHVQFVQHDVLGRGQPRFRQVPASRAAAVLRSSSDTMWLRVLLRASETEYGSVTTLVSTLLVLRT